MADETCVRTLLAAEANGKVRAGYVIQLMRGSLKHQAVHDRGHVTGRAAGTCRFCGVVRVRGALRSHGDVTLNAHPVRIIAKFQGSGIGRGIGRMGIVTSGALGRSAAETGGAEEGLPDERGLAKSPIPVKGARTKLGQGLAEEP